MFLFSVVIGQHLTLDWMQQLYQKALAIKSAIPHPRIMGIIRECGGKMHMAERQWADAATDFFEAFKNYDEAGNQRRIQCLKYALQRHICFLSIFLIHLDLLIGAHFVCVSLSPSCICVYRVLIALKSRGQAINSYVL